MAAENARPIDAIPTHLPTWNGACLGFGGGIGLARGWHVIVAAPANQGKSMLALNLAYAALEAGRSVAYILLEGSQRDLLSRLYPLVSGESSRTMQPGAFYNPGTFEKAAQMFDALCQRHGGRLWVADKAVRTLPVVLDTINAGECWPLDVPVECACCRGVGAMRWAEYDGPPENAERS